MMNKKLRGMKKATVALAIAASVMGSVAPVVAHADMMDDFEVMYNFQFDNEEEDNEDYLKFFEWEIPDKDEFDDDGIDISDWDEVGYREIIDAIYGASELKILAYEKGEGL